ncbi:MAG: hypothetical protein ACOC4M_06150 [Promethearchaeia archaeon]
MGAKQLIRIIQDLTKSAVDEGEYKYDIDLHPADSGYISYIDKKELGTIDDDDASVLKKVLRRIMELVENSRYPRSEYQYGDNTDYHRKLMPEIFNNEYLKQFIIANELSVWHFNKFKGAMKLLTGHIDNLALIDAALFVMDFKPGDDHIPDSSTLSEHLFQSIPQVAAYARIIEYMLDLKSGSIPVYAVSYNSKGAYIYTPQILGAFDAIFEPAHFRSKATWDENFASYNR